MKEPVAGRQGTVQNLMGAFYNHSGAGPNSTRSTSSLLGPQLGGVDTEISRMWSLPAESGVGDSKKILSYYGL